MRGARSRSPSVDIVSVLGNSTRRFFAALLGRGGGGILDSALEAGMGSSCGLGDASAEGGAEGPVAERCSSSMARLKGTAVAGGRLSYTASSSDGVGDSSDSAFHLAGTPSSIASSVSSGLMLKSWLAANGDFEYGKSGDMDSMARSAELGRRAEVAIELIDFASSSSRYSSMIFKHRLHTRTAPSCPNRLAPMMLDAHRLQKI